MVIKTFKRHEIKYMVTEEQYETLKFEILNHMVLDAYCKDKGSYRIYNLYFDNDNDDIIKKSLLKPYYKEKLRLRSYNMPIAGEDMVFLELKKKIGGVVAKRRAKLTCTQADDLLFENRSPKTNNYQDKQVISEILDFITRNKADASDHIEPKVYISYERIAFFDKANPDFRVSFDHKLLARRDQVNLNSDDFGNSILDNGYYLMEIKCQNIIPIWLCHLLSEMQIYSRGFSKYGTEYRQFVQQQQYIIHYNTFNKVSASAFEYPERMMDSIIL